MMATTTGIKIAGVDVGSIFAAYSFGTKLNCGMESDGTDLGQLLQPIGSQSPNVSATGVVTGGKDLNAWFSNTTSLPFQGQQINGQLTTAGSTNSCVVQFNTNNSAWSVTTRAGAVTLYSGSIPPGATQVQLSISTASGTPNNVTTAASMTALSGSNLVCSASASGPVGGSTVSGISNVTITYANSSGATVSVTTCTFSVSA